MNTILTAHSLAWLDSRAYRWAWLSLPLATIAMVFGLLYGITPNNNLRLLPYPKEYSQKEEAEIVAALKSDTQGTLKKLRDAAADEDPRAINLLGELYDPLSELKGFVSPDFNQALVYFEKAAALGSSLAMYNAGQLHSDNYDGEKSCEYIKKASAAGRIDNDTSSRTGHCLVISANSSAADKVKGMEMLNAAASSGHGYAYYLLGLIYYNKPHLDIPRAIEFFEKAVAHKAYDWGHSRLILGDIFFQGQQSIPQDFLKAKVHFEKSLEQGRKTAALRLALFYAKDRSNIKEDFKKAFKYAKIAADHGISEGHYYLYVHYVNGEGVDRNYDLATNHALNAISLGHKTALERANKGNTAFSKEIITRMQQKMTAAMMYSGPIDGVANEWFQKAVERLPGSKRHFGPK